MNDEDRLLELPVDEEELQGDSPVKRVKRKKSKEERVADRRVVMWTLLLVLGVTMFFWLWPKLANLRVTMPIFKKETLPKEEKQKFEIKNYVEYKL